jgi:beta-glucuronidase
METIKNFVDNIHNESYKDSYASPCLGANSYVIPGGRTAQSLDGAWNFSVDMYDNCSQGQMVSGAGGEFRGP